MQNISVHTVLVGKGPRQIESVVILCGTDVSVYFGGGEAYHVGAVALATPRASHLDPNLRSSSASVLCVHGHMEDVLCRDAALKISATLNTVVSVTVGIHIDHATASDIKSIEKNFWQAVEEVCQILHRSIKEVGT